MTGVGALKAKGLLAQLRPTVEAADVEVRAAVVLLGRLPQLPTPTADANNRTHTDRYYFTVREHNLLYEYRLTPLVLFC